MTKKKLEEQPELSEEIKDREQWVKEFVEEFKVNTKSFKGKTHLFLIRVTINPEWDEQTLHNYLDSCQASFAPEMKKCGWAAFYIPTVEETSMTVVDLRTMKYVKI